MTNLREMFGTMTPDEIRSASRDRELEEWRAVKWSGELKPDGDEVVESGWFDRDHLPEIPSKGSIARALIDDWLNTPCADS